MDVWVVHTGLKTLDDRQQGLNSAVVIDWKDFPDFSNTQNKQDIKQRLRAYDETITPEALERLSAECTQWVHQVQPEDILVMPLPDGKLAFAEVAGPYRCITQPDGSLKHQRPVQWLQKQLSVRSFKKSEQPEFSRYGTSAIHHVQSRLLRVKIRDKLPLSYNGRFARWKWILGVILCLKLMMLLYHTIIKP